MLQKPDVVQARGIVLVPDLVDVTLTTIAFGNMHLPGLGLIPGKADVTRDLMVSRMIHGVRGHAAIGYRAVTPAYLGMKYGRATTAIQNYITVLSCSCRKSCAEVITDRLAPEYGNIFRQMRIYT